MPSDVELEQCNLGYARGCGRFPQEREADAIRFSVMREKDGQIVLCYVSELNYLPRDSGSLKYESLTKRWLHMHPNQRVQGMAECFLQSYLEKRGRNERERNDD